MNAAQHLTNLHADLADHPEVKSLVVPNVIAAATDSHKKLLEWVEQIAGWPQHCEFDNLRKEAEEDMKSFDKEFATLLDFSRCLGVIKQEKNEDNGKVKEKNRATKERFARFYTKRATPNLIARYAAARDLNLPNYCQSHGMEGIGEVPFDPVQETFVKPFTLFEKDQAKWSPMHQRARATYKDVIGHIKERLTGFQKKIVKSGKTHGVKEIEFPKTVGDVNATASAADPFNT